jgi:hypothetical protein
MLSVTLFRCLPAIHAANKFIRKVGDYAYLGGDFTFELSDIENITLRRSTKIIIGSEAVTEQKVRLRVCFSFIIVLILH